MRKPLYLVAIAAIVAASPAFAAATIGNTGFDQNWKSGYISNESAEPTAAMIGNAAQSAATVVTTPDRYWAGGDTNVSKWVSVNSGGIMNAGWYVYSNQFSANANDSVTFDYAVDDKLVKVLLNGNYVGTNWGGTYNSYSSGKISGLTAGVNTLSFLVSNNTPGGNDPTNATGLRFINTTTTAVPEPATWAMMLLGFGVVGLSLRRKSMLRFA